MTSPLDPEYFRHVMAQVPTTVTVVTGFVDAAPVAMVIGSFVSISLDPPLAGFFCTTGSASWAALRQAPVFGVNVLSADQVDVSNAFMRPPAERFEGIEWTIGSGAPRIANTSAWIVMEPDQILDAGDHEFAMCRVLEMDAPETPVGPLVFHGGSYRVLSPEN